jgi:hypothetical protein
LEIFTSRKGVERSFRSKAEKTSARGENLGFPLGAERQRREATRKGIRKIVPLKGVTASEKNLFF